MRKILVCAATGTEANAVIEGIRSANLESTFYVLRTGMGPLKAEFAIRRHLMEYTDYDLIVSTGFAYSWDPRLGVGDWTVSEVQEFWDLEHTNCQYKVETNSYLFSKFPPRYHRSRQFTFSSFIEPATLKQIPSPSHQDTLRFVGDMESATTALIAQEFQIPYLNVRKISDTLNRPTPKFVGAWMEALEQGSLVQKIRRVLRAFRLTFSRPWVLVRFLISGKKLRDRFSAEWSRLAKIVLQSSYTPVVPDKPAKPLISDLAWR